MTTTETLGFDDAVTWAYHHTGHFTNEPSKNMLRRLASDLLSGPQFRCVQWLSPRGEDITVIYNRDSGTYTCEATPRAEPAGTTLLRELRHDHGIDG